MAQVEVAGERTGIPAPSGAHRWDPGELKLRFLVRAEIRADPLNVPVEFLADLERDTGRIRVAQR